MATLVHDDVIDKSDKRRGRLTISKKWDQSTAILTGNFLLAMGLKHLSEISDTRVHSTISKSIVDVCRENYSNFKINLIAIKQLLITYVVSTVKQHFLFNCLHKLVRLLQCVK